MKTIRQNNHPEANDTLCVVLTLLALTGLALAVGLLPAWMIIILYSFVFLSLFAAEVVIDHSPWRRLRHPGGRTHFHPHARDANPDKK